MSVRSNVERAESAMRKELINALAEGEDCLLYTSDAADE